MAQLETHRGGSNSADCGDPIDFVRDVTAGFPNVQPCHVFGWIGIRGIRQRLADEHSVIDPAELWGRPEVPDGRNTTGVVLVEKVLSEDGIRGEDIGKDINQLLDCGIFCLSVVPDVEYVTVDRR